MSFLLNIWVSREMRRRGRQREGEGERIQEYFVDESFAKLLIRDFAYKLRAIKHTHALHAFINPSIHSSAENARRCITLSGNTSF